MKLRSSLSNSSLKLDKLTGLLVAASLLLALSTKPIKADAQEKDNQTSQSISTKDKYFVQLLAEIEKEMKISEEKEKIENNKQIVSKITKDFSNEVCFNKEKKENTLDTYLESLQKEILSIKSDSQISAFVDKMISFLSWLQQKSAVIGQEKVWAGSKELSSELVEIYIAKFTAFKTKISKKWLEQSSDLLSSSPIILLLQEAKTSIQSKESQYLNQIELNDSLKQDYTKLTQFIYDLESQVASISTQIQEKKLQAEIAQKEFSTFEDLGTNISEQDFEKKVQLMKDISILEEKDSILSVSLENLNADLVVKSNSIPVKEVNINQNQSKLDDIQKWLLEEKDKQYSKISSRFKQESVAEITTQEQKIEEQMSILKKTIDSYNLGIDSLTTVLQQINQNLPSQSKEWESVISERSVTIQKVLKEYVKYSQELEKLYSMYKSILIQNKEAIIKLEQDNPFIKTDVSSLENEKEEIERVIESLRVNITAKEKEKSETKDDARVIVLINELTTLYTDLDRSDASFKQIQKLLKQRKDFDNNYIQRKDKETLQIDNVVSYLDNNISSAKYAIEAFVYWYNMQIVKKNIENLSVKLNGSKIGFDENNGKLVLKQNEEKEKRQEILNLKIDDKQKLQKEKDILVKINTIKWDINSLKTALAKDKKNLDEYKKLDQEQRKLYKDLAVLALDALESYLGYGMNSIELKKSLNNNNYPVSDKQPTDIPSFYTSIETLLKGIEEAGIKAPFTIEKIKQLYK